MNCAEQQAVPWAAGSQAAPAPHPPDWSNVSDVVASWGGAGVSEVLLRFAELLHETLGPAWTCVCLRDLHNHREHQLPLSRSAAWNRERVACTSAPLLQYPGVTEWCCARERGNFRSLTLPWAVPDAAGGLVLTFPLERFPGEPARLMLRHLARQFAGLLRGEMLSERLHFLTRRLAEIHHLSEVVTKAATVQEIYQTALRAVLHCLPVDRASLLVFDDDGVMRFKAWQGLSEPYRKAVEGHSPWPRGTFDPQPILMEDVAASSLPPELKQTVLGEGIRALAFIPLSYQGRLLGKFMLYYNQPHHFSQEELHLARSLASQVGFALDRKQAEAVLRESEEDFRALFELSGVGQVQVDSEGRFLRVNRKVCQLLGYTASELMARGVEEVTHPEDIPVTRARIKDLLLGRSGEFQLEKRYLHKSGRVLWGHVTANLVQNHAGRPVRLAAIIQDITDRKQVEIRMRMQHAISKILAENENPGEIVSRLLEAVCTSLQCPVGAVWQVDPRVQRLRCTEMWAVPALEQTEFVARSRRFEFASGTGFPGRIWAGRKPEWIVDLSRDGNFPRAPFAAGAGLRSAVGFPMVFGDEFLGMLEFFQTEVQEPDEELMKVLNSVGDQVGHFLHRRRTEEALRQSQHQLQLIADGLPLLVSLFDPEQRCLFVNRVCERWFGFSRSEALGRSLQEISGRHYAALLPHFLTALDGRETVHSFWIPFQKDGRHYVRTSCIPLFDRYKRVEGVIILVSDETARKRSAEERERSQKQIRQLNENLQRRVQEFKTLLDVIPIGIGIAEDQECRNITVNPAFARMLGISPEANASLSAPDSEKPTNFKVFHEGRELLPEELPMQVAASQGIEIIGLELDVVRDDGRVLNLLEYASPLLDAQGQTRGSVGAFLNITERKRAEASQRFLADLGEQIRPLANQEEVSWVVVRAVANYLRVSRCFCVDVRPESEELVVLRNYTRGGRSLEGVYPFGWIDPMLMSDIRAGFPVVVRDAETDPRTAMFYDSFYKRIPIRSFLVVPLVKNDQPVWMMALAEAEEPRNWTADEVTLLRIIIERTWMAVQNARLFESEQAARAEAESASRAKDHFLAVLSHELRTPLTPVLLTLDTLAKSSLPSPLQRSLEVIRRNVALEARLIDDLLDLSRVIHRKLEISLQPVDLHRLVRAALQICEGEIQQKRQRLELQLAATHGMLQGDAARLQQVIWNLIKNATKFTPEEGRIRIETRLQEGWVVLEVTDTGIGIPADALERIFDAFEQADPNIAPRFGGLGLGLTISKAIIDAHGGRLIASSPGPNQGSTFRVELKAQPAPAPAAPPSV